MRAGVQTPASTEKVRCASWLHATPAEGTETGDPGASWPVRFAEIVTSGRDLDSIHKLEGS